MSEKLSRAVARAKGRLAYLAFPKGLDLTAGVVVAGENRGEDSGLGTADGAPDRGKSSNFRRARVGVGG